MAEYREVVALVRFRSYAGTDEELAERLKRTLETHPTLSLRIESVQVFNADDNDSDGGEDESISSG